MVMRPLYVIAVRRTRAAEIKVALRVWRSWRSRSSSRSELKMYLPSRVLGSATFELTWRRCAPTPRSHRSMGAAGAARPTRPSPGRRRDAERGSAHLADRLPHSRAKRRRNASRPRLSGQHQRRRNNRRAADPCVCDNQLLFLAHRSDDDRAVQPRPRVATYTSAGVLDRARQFLLSPLFLIRLGSTRRRMSQGPRFKPSSEHIRPARRRSA